MLTNIVLVTGKNEYMRFMQTHLLIPHFQKLCNKLYIPQKRLSLKQYGTKSEM